MLAPHNFLKGINHLKKRVIQQCILFLYILLFFIFIFFVVTASICISQKWGFKGLASFHAQNH